MLNDLHKLVRTRASDGALQLQERTAETICSLPTIARPDTFRVNLAGEGLYVRTLHGESTARHLLCALRGQSVRFSLHRDGAPAVATSARRQSSSHQPV